MGNNQEIVHDGPVISVSGVSKTYQGEIEAVKNISFDVPKGQVLGFLGPNGAGKTTTMRIITGYMPPSKGHVYIDGNEIFDQPKQARKRIGYLPEHPPLYLEMTPAEYLVFVAKIKGVRKKDIGERLDYVLEKCGLTEVAHRLMGQLSKGFRQRVGLAQALIHDPMVLILDEPTIGLDPRQIREIRTLIRSLRGEHTVILSTHILPEVSMTCDRAVIINNGEIVADDTLERLGKKGLGDSRVIIRLTQPGKDVIERLSKIQGVLSVAAGEESGKFIISIDPLVEAAPDISLEILTQGWGLAELSRPAESLEEAFVRLTAV